MADEWVVVELSPRGEGEDPELLVKSIQNTIKGAEVFVPALVSQVAEEKVVKYLWEGYVFIRRTHTDSTYFKLEGTRYVQKILTQPGPGRDRLMATVSSKQVESLRSQIKVETDQGIRVGDEVKVTSGPYKGISGRVIEEIPEDDSVQVFIKLRSKEAIVTLPRSWLKFQAHSNEALPVFPRDDRLSRWRAWFNRVRRLFAWPENSVAEVENHYARWSRLNEWVVRGRRADEFIRALSSTVDVSSVQEKFEEWRAVSGWAARESALQHSVVISKYDSKGYHAVERSRSEWSWLQGILARVDTVRRAVTDLERTLNAVEHPNVTQNVIIDGHNLAFRCMFVDKRGLTDKQGRPTGIMFGVLQSLTSLKKKHPNAQLYVVWDSGRKRRESLFPAYKANRDGNPAMDGPQVLALKESLLPVLGVHQLYEPGEETDDLIATLVRGTLKGQRNLILSTDRDFLQLVTETDSLLCPRQVTKTDPRTEVLFNPAEVVGQHGVEPSRMVQLRALLGDPSDNIPGVPRVPDKILKALLQAHGSVEGIYASSLSGLTAKQYETLRNFEKQAHLNVQLMTLKTDVPYSLKEGTPNQGELERRLSEYDIRFDNVVSVFFR